MKTSHSLAFATAAVAFQLLAAHTASAQQLNIQRWATGEGSWPPAANHWLAGDFSGHRRLYGTPAKDLAMVWSYDNAINIDIHNSEIDEGGAHAGPRGFGLYRAATADGGWPATAQWVAGDFNHDGLTDIADAFQDASNGIDIDVHLNEGGSFSDVRAATSQGGWVGGTFVAGDFNADGWDDIALVWTESNQITIDVHVNLQHPGTPEFQLERWATNQGGWVAGATILAGNFDNQPGTDIAYAFPAVPSTLGTLLVDIHSSTRSGFVLNRWENEYNFGGVSFLDLSVADIDGNGRDDIALAWNDGPNAYYPGNIDIAAWQSSGTGFFPYEGTNQPTWLSTGQGSWPVRPQFVAADFDGDGLGDVADVFDDNGGIDIDVHAH